MMLPMLAMSGQLDHAKQLESPSCHACLRLKTKDVVSGWRDCKTVCASCNKNRLRPGRCTGVNLLLITNVAND